MQIKYVGPNKTYSISGVSFKDGDGHTRDVPDTLGKGLLGLKDPLTGAPLFEDTSVKKSGVTIIKKAVDAPTEEALAVLKANLGEFKVKKDAIAYGKYVLGIEVDSSISLKAMNELLVEKTAALTAKPEAETTEGGEDGAVQV